METILEFGTWHYSRECGNSPNRETGVGIPVHSCARYIACSATTEEVVGGVVLDQPLPPLASGLATAVSARFRSEALAGQAPSSFIICSQCKRQNMTPMWCECRIRLAKRKPYKV
ncbi:hypothetical protein BDQ94DRAFT_143522 [Aspergillus welwitschiae]|uniref:Uncharacterized protein n=1 Tax=Aspergillus welwitschiae TaxID=1341132 RepID=A0A3F3Q362_9EURO|nr:hypothetical protein BDQ94DRAFT_143522 [Aspergillus welwitschiae]RDH33664.1 hypothetical protein BDQ94DRAFT_143522 [Aspergillus welwitschiae]